MAYHAEFINAKNFQGERYRDDSGNPINHCIHSFIIRPIFRTDTDYHAELIPQDKKSFDGFDGICELCGEWINISHENVLSQENFEKREKELVDELRKGETKNVRRKKRRL